MYFIEENGGISARGNREIIRIEAWGENSLRIRATENHSFSGHSGGLIGDKTDGTVVIDEQSATIANGRISAQIKKNGKIVIMKDGSPILTEYSNPYAPAIQLKAREFRSLGGSDYATALRFLSNEGEKIYGMGQYQQPYLELKGSVMPLMPQNAQISIPFYISNLGYGFLWNDPSVGKVSFGKNMTEWSSRRSSEIDYWITAGDTPAEIVKNYTAAVGRAPEFPDDLLGLWQCKLRYRTEEEVLEVAREYKRRNLPIDVIVIDYYHWMHDGDWSFDPDFWPDPASMVKKLKDMGIRCMVSVWPTVQNNSINFKEMAEKGLLVNSYKGEAGGIFGKQFYDATNPEGQKMIWQNVKRNYYDCGIDMFWLDCNEPEFLPADFEHYSYFAGQAEKVAGLYPLMHIKAFYDGMKSVGAEPIVNLARSAWVGAQRYGAVLWSGDIKSDFNTLRTQICAGLNIGLAGIPWWTTDTAGFVGSIDDPGYNELLIRWFQFSTFSPVLRLHGNLAPYKIPRLSANKNSGGYATTGQPHELWSHGEEVYEILKKYLFIREGLKPYIKELTREASLNGSPLLRTMFYEFPDDSRCWELQDQYMFGNKYLVAPITYVDMRERTVYLPEGTWKNFYTGEIILGGREILVDAPLDIIPVFERLSYMTSNR